jgi:hypothetical protein
MKIIDALVYAAFAFGLPAAAYLLPILASHLKASTHNLYLARITDAASRIAGRMSRAAQALPPGSNAAAVEATSIAAGVAELRAEFAQSVAGIGGTDDKLAGIIAGELGKLAPAIPADLVKDAIGAAIAAAASPAPAAPVSPAAIAAAA